MRRFIVLVGYLVMAISIYYHTIKYSCWGYVGVDGVVLLTGTCTATGRLPAHKTLPRAFDRFKSFDVPRCLRGHGEHGFVCHSASRRCRPRRTQRVLMRRAADQEHQG